MPFAKGQPICDACLGYHEHTNPECVYVRVVRPLKDYMCCMCGYKDYWPMRLRIDPAKVKYPHVTKERKRNASRKP